MSKIKLGCEARDKVTGFVGIVIGHTVWLTGCDTITVKPKVSKDGKIEEAQYFDEGQIEVIGEGIHAKEVKSKKNGGPRADCMQC